MMDLKQHLLRQMAFSTATFGPGRRTLGVVDHITKELREVLESNGSPSEWVDVVILALDGFSRSLLYQDGQVPPSRDVVADMVCAILENKQSKNENRVWPDWRKSDPNKAIEHDRSYDEESNE